MVPRWQRGFVAACAGIIAHALTYAATTYGHLPKATYYQLDRLWRFEVRAQGTVPSGYVGMWIWALLAGLIAGSATWVAMRWRSKPIGEASLSLAMAWAGTAFVIVGGYYSWNNWP